MGQVRARLCAEWETAELLPGAVTVVVLNRVRPSFHPTFESQCLPRFVLFFVLSCFIASHFSSVKKNSFECAPPLSPLRHALPLSLFFSLSSVSLPTSQSSSSPLVASLHRFQRNFLPSSRLCRACFCHLRSGTASLPPLVEWSAAGPGHKHAYGGSPGQAAAPRHPHLFLPRHRRWQRSRQEQARP